MGQKFSTLIILLLLTSCDLIFGWDKREYIATQPVKFLKDNKGSLISLDVVAHNYLKPMNNEHSSCMSQVNFEFTYSTPIKATYERKHSQNGNPEFQFIKNGKTKGRFHIPKSDIYLLHDGQKIYPKIWYGGKVTHQEYDEVESSSIAYSDYKRYGRVYLKFGLSPCTKLLDHDTKLVIERIYKDNQVIKKDIEFSFIKSKQNKSYSIWLE